MSFLEERGRRLISVQFSYCQETEWEESMWLVCGPEILFEISFRILLGSILLGSILLRHIWFLNYQTEPTIPNGEFVYASSR